MLIILYSLAAFFLSFNVFMGTMINARDHRLSKNLRVVSGVLLFWQILVILGLIFANEKIFYISSALNPALESITITTMLIYVIEFYSPRKYVTPVSVALLGTIPVMTLILAVTDSSHGMVVTAINANIGVPIHSMVQYGTWAWINKGYCFLLVAAAAVIVGRLHGTVPGVYRKSSTWIIYSVAAAALGGVLSVLPISPDFGLMGASAGVAFLFMCTISTSKLDFLNILNSRAINEIDKAFFVLDTEGNVINRNNVANQLLEKADVGTVVCEGESFSAVFERAFKGAKLLEQKESGGIDYINPEAFPGKTFNVRSKSIMDKKSAEIGTIYICTDVSENRTLMNRLEDESGMDALTGLFNRGKMDELAALLDRPENLPIAVLVADLNNLKTINDTKGHQQGDLLIRSAAQKLSKSCPPKSCIARIGGDEFLVLIPEYSEQAAKKVVEKIMHTDPAPDTDEIHPNMAIGMTIKTTAEDELNNCIKEADRRMYENKRMMKKTG